GLLLALRAFENEHMIDLAAGPIDTSDRRDEVARTDRADVRAILNVKVGDKPRVQSRLAIPGERIEILTHWVKRVVPRRRLHRSTKVAGRRIDLLPLKPDPRQSVVVISPGGFGCFLAPGRALPDDYPRAELVVAEHAFPLRSVPQDQD